MKLNFSRALLQLLALLTGLTVAAIWRDRHNILANYPEFESSKAELGLGVVGAQSFMHSPVTLAAGALNLGSWFGHQEILLKNLWPSFPALSARIRGDGVGDGDGSELEFEFRAGGARGVRTALRLSNRAEHPSAWLEIGADGFFKAKTLIPYTLPDGKWIQVQIREESGSIRAVAGGESLPEHVAPAGPVQVLFRGYSSAGRARINDIHLSAGNETYDQPFAGQTPWLLFLLVTLAASGLLFFVERSTSPRAAAVISGTGILLLCSLFALVRGSLEDRYPLELNLEGVPRHIETRDEILLRLEQLPPLHKPVLLWLGGSQPWGAGASSPDSTAFSRLKHKLEARSGMVWINGASSGSSVADQIPALERVRRNNKVAFVVITSGVNDRGTPDFIEALKTTIANVRSGGARLFLLPEAVERGTSDEISSIERQSQTKTTAESENVPHFEAQRIFDERVDDGYFWWDFVHQTDAGAKVMAEALEKPLSEALSKTAAR